ncbi:MAG: cell division protein ZapA [Proteobacteria bacterium]|jgi:cell division protein ZapA (FtsZ GTPase activity inhibitor)|nr:cell division protein ZapA [Pseudomonadota bacterium]
MRSYTIAIGGHSFQIRSDADPEHVKQLADEVGARYDAIDKKGPRAEQEFRALAMVAIVLMDELLDARKQGEQIRESTRGFVAQLIARIDDVLAAGQTR